MTGCALVLSGGGARAAYQAGVLSGLSTLWDKRQGPFPIYVGASAGAINSAFMASVSDMAFDKGTDQLKALWLSMQIDKVVKANFGAVGGSMGRWLRDLSFAGRLSRRTTTYLLDTNPLRHFIESNLDFERLARNLDQGQLHALGISATNYLTGSNVVFFNGSKTILPWIRHGRLASRTRLTADHVLASASIPVFFEPVKIQGTYYGDGAVRLTAPLSSAIHMGAKRIMAVSVQHQRKTSLTLALNRQGIMSDISLIDIFGTMLNAVFLDALEMDGERMQRINVTARALQQEGINHPYQLRDIPLFMIRPSQDLGSLASEQFHSIPRSFRYLLRGLGASPQKGWDLISYLAFNRGYIEPVMELGYQDVMDQSQDIKAFLNAES